MFFHSHHFNVCCVKTVFYICSSIQDNSSKILKFEHLLAANTENNYAVCFRHKNKENNNNTMFFLFWIELHTHICAKNINNEISAKMATYRYHDDWRLQIPYETRRGTYHPYMLHIKHLVNCFNTKLFLFFFFFNNDIPFSFVHRKWIFQFSIHSFDTQSNYVLVACTLYRLYFVCFFFSQLFICWLWCWRAVSWK